MEEHITVTLPDDLLQRAKDKAADEGRTVDSLIEEGLRLVIPRSKGKSDRPKGDLPVSSARGGLLPGVDLTRFSDIQGMDDLEYAERLKAGFK